MKDERGFTLVELIIVLGMTAMFVGLIMYFTFNYWRFSFALDADVSSFVERLNASDFIREQVGTSSGLINQNNLADDHPMVLDTTNATNNYWVPIHAIPGNTTMPASGSYKALLYYRRPSVNTAGNIVYNGTQPYEDQFLLYLDGSTKSLRLRSLANSAAASNKLKTSCPVTFVTADCPADKTLISDISSVDTRYFSRNGTTLDYTSSVDIDGNYNGPDYASVEVLELTLNITKKAVFQSVSNTRSSTIIRIALRNT